MTALTTCSTCGSGNRAEVAQCWVCGAALGGSGATPFVVASETPELRAERRTHAVIWLTVLVGLAITATLVAVELALNWPGLMVPYSLVMFATFVALARTAWTEMRRKSAEGRDKSRGQDIVESVALGVGVTIGVLAALILLMVAAAVLFFVICMAIAVTG